MKKILALTLLLSAITGQLNAQVLLQDSFSYADGYTPTVSSSAWTRFSGTLNDSLVSNQKLQVWGTPTRTDDITRPISPFSQSVVWASFLVNSTNINNGQTNYFAHFSDGGTSNFKCRVFTVGNQGLAPNTWRLGIANSSGSGSVNVKIYPLDLATNIDYQVVISYDTNNFVSTLWVDPVAITDQSVQPADTATIQKISNFCFRQSSPGQALTVDNLYVGSNFVDVAVGTPKRAAVYYSPNPVVNAFTGNSTNLYCVGGGAGAVSFKWQKNGADLVDDANTIGSQTSVLQLVNVLAGQSGSYKCIITSVTNSVVQNTATSAVSVVTFSAAPVPPTITSQPASQFAYRGQNVTFSVAVSSPGNLTYQWYSNNIVLPSETASSITVPNVTTNGNGALFKVAVTNDVVVNGVISSNATLTVSNPPHVSIAFLRKLVDPTTYQATNFTQPYEITGIVTTYTNITTGNTASYYLQDGTAGINIFVTGDSSFRPQQGDVITYVGVTSSFNSGFELVADTTKPYTSYNNIISNNFPLPAPIKIPFTVTNNNYSNVIYSIAGSRVQLNNVFFGPWTGLSLSTTANTNVVVTNSLGQTFTMNFFFLDQDTAGQTLPNYASTVTGILYGNTNFSLAVTKFSDIVTNVLDASYAGGNLTLNWTTPFGLQTATNISGPWTDVGVNTGYWVTNTVTYPTVFYRLLNP